ncbi:hypothetical protein DACRYDRAFT_64551 [Dacryopinax primogenitus]|uniref:Peptidase S54 rhomboid domain-containing protein n=1 Tax=Dacryopinax primogenitus (strain DJM 731) TaxID=1858805 RepID=M5G005_DACPD|nr:uncharacterized protein DACRYDRAFT_64551 [Dacryopinax primogenitus]EJU03596.1 hypothetical protein DACRYDRAFT_64551 [Dacryopinax primogenitus]
MSRFGSSLPVCARIRPAYQSWTRFAPRRFNYTLRGGDPSESFVANVRPVFWRPILFSVGVGVGTYGLAAYYTNEDTRKWAKSLSKDAWWRTGGPSGQEMQRARKIALHRYLTDELKGMVDSTKHWPTTIRVYAQRAWITFAEMVLNSSDGRRAAASIVCLNAAIFMGWQIPILRHFMASHFLHSPLSGKSYTLLTSAFSHQGLVHMGFNMFALVSFGSAAFDWLGTQQAHVERQPESTYFYHAFSFYVLGGLFSSLLSHVVAARFRFPRMVAALTAGNMTGATNGALTSILPSLGASGAIYATVTLSALALPEATVSFILLPWVQVPISAGVGSLVLLDVIGVMRGWRTFDHWAHLGGAAFGVFYYYYGPELWNWTRRRLAQAMYRTKP